MNSELLLENPFNISRKERPLILDGAMGSLLQQKGLKPDKSSWMTLANFNHPELVREIHTEYIEAGADIITTNTFRTNPISLKDKSIINKDKIVKNTVKLAIEARGKSNVFIAGSNAPAEDCYQKERTISASELIYNHQHHINQLYSAGVDFILNETQSHFDEINIICEYCYKEKIPFVVSLFIDEKLKLLSGEDIDFATKYISDYSPLAIGINCISPKIFEKYFFKKSFDYNWGIYLNCGSGNLSDNKIECGITPHVYITEIKKILSKNPSFVGACCGSNPNHIKELFNLFNEKF